MVQITAVQMVGGIQHEHIAQLYWIDLQTNERAWATRQQMVNFLSQAPGQAIVRDQFGSIEVRIVNTTPQYVRTYADERWTDNLLSLPGGPNAR